MRDKKEKNVILINKMYTGSYLDDNNGNNIGHEIINFFKTKDGENYIYITPYGKYKYGERIKYVLFTTPKIDGKYEIIAKAKIKKHKIDEKNANNNNNGYILKEPYREEHNEQALNIKYGDKSIYDIYKDNINNDEAIYASFEVEYIYKLKNGVRIEVNLNSTKNNKEDKTVVTIFKNGNTESSKSFAHEKVKTQKGKKKKIIPLNIGMSNIIYLNPNDKVELANYFSNIIDNKSLWEEKKTCKIEISEQEKQEAQENKKFNFLNLIQKEYDENIFTNLLEYYFNVKYKKDIILNEFLSWLSINDKEFKERSKYHSNIKFSKILKEYEIEIKKDDRKDKEENQTNSEKISKGRIDLFASYISKNDNIYLVIENKIKSKINGKKENGYQLQFYKTAIEEDHVNSKFIGIILVPNYNKELIENEEGYRDVKNVYTIVTYEKLYKFFTTIEKDKLDDENARRYFEDFNNALSIHILSAEKKEENKFKKAILNAKEIKYTVFVVRFKKSKSEKEKVEYKYYVGTTTNLDIRKGELDKNNKFKGYERDDFIWFKEYDSLNNAIDVERKLEDKINEKLTNENKILEKVDILELIEIK